MSLDPSSAFLGIPFKNINRYVIKDLCNKDIRYHIVYNRGILDAT